MRITLQCVVSLGLMAAAVVSWPACSRDSSPSPPVTNATPTEPAATTTPVSPAGDASPNSSGSSTDLTTAFPINPNAAPPNQNNQTTASTVPIQAVDADEFRAVVEKHRGKVVLVDCWATWCGPCKEQFPHTVQLGRQHADRGLAVVSMSFDDPEQMQNVAAFLEKQNANFDHLISKTGASVESFVKFEIDGGALPFYKLYDRSGKLRYQFCGDNTGLTNVLKVEELDKRLEELLAERT